MLIYSAAGRFCWRISYSTSIISQGVQKSEKEAFEYFQKSASKGNADAIG